MDYHVLNHIKWFTNWPLKEFSDYVLSPLFEGRGAIYGKNNGVFKWKRVQSVRELESFRLLFNSLLKRIDDLLCYYVNEDLIQKKWTIDSLGNVSLLQLDIYSLIIFSRIYLNKIARILHNYLHEGFGDDRFSKWFDKAKSVSNEDVREIILTVKDFPFFNLLRDKYSIHHGHTEAGIGYHNGMLRLIFLSYLSDCADISLEIDKMIEYCDQMFETTKLNFFLLKNKENIPIRDWK